MDSSKGKQETSKTESISSVKSKRKTANSKTAMDSGSLSKKKKQRFQKRKQSSKFFGRELSFTDANLPKQALDLDSEELELLEKQEVKPQWKRYLASFVRPSLTEVDETELAAYRVKVREYQELERMKKETRKMRRERMKQKQKLKLLELHEQTIGTLGGLPGRRSFLTGAGGGGQKRSAGLMPQTSKMMLRKDSRGSLIAFDPAGEGEEVSKVRSTPAVHSLPKGGEDDEAELRYRMYLQSTMIPSHFSALCPEEEILRKHKEKRRRKISQLYSGEVYHHSWDQLRDHAKFETILNEAIRKNYPITPSIQKKMDEIRTKREEKQTQENQRLQKREFDRTCFTRMKRNISNWWNSTTLGEAFNATPRYTDMKPVVPEYCRRCRYSLQDTLERRFTPTAITFALLFPLIGIICCYSNVEFVCVVCEEIYYYGDYPSRCRPLDKDKLVEIQRNVQLKTRTFNTQPTRNSLGGKSKRSRLSLTSYFSKKISMANFNNQ